MGVEKNIFWSNSQERKEQIKTVSHYTKDFSSWVFYDSSAESYGNDFDKIFSIYWVEYIIDHFQKNNKMGRAVAIDFGGQGDKVFSEFGEGVFKRTFGVCLGGVQFDKIIKDNCGRLMKVYPDGRKHYFVQGNILNKTTYNELNNKVSRGSVDLITCRLVGGCLEIPTDPCLLMSVAQKWYEMLSFDGLMFLDLYGLIDVSLLTEWVKFINSNDFGIHIAQWKYLTQWKYLICLHKQKTALKKLPGMGRKRTADFYKKSGVRPNCNI